MRFVRLHPVVSHEIVVMVSPDALNVGMGEKYSTHSREYGPMEIISPK